MLSLHTNMAHMWNEFVFGSRPCSEGFSRGSPVWLSPQNQHSKTKIQFDVETVDERSILWKPLKFTFIISK